MIYEWRSPVSVARACHAWRHDEENEKMRKKKRDQGKLKSEDVKIHSIERRAVTHTPWA